MAIALYTATDAYVALTEDSADPEVLSVSHDLQNVAGTDRAVVMCYTTQAAQFDFGSQFLSVTYDGRAPSIVLQQRVKPNPLMYSGIWVWLDNNLPPVGGPHIAEVQVSNANLVPLRQAANVMEMTGVDQGPAVDFQTPFETVNADASPDIVYTPAPSSSVQLAFMLVSMPVQTFVSSTSDVLLRGATGPHTGGGFVTQLAVAQATDGTVDLSLNGTTKNGSSSGLALAASSAPPAGSLAPQATHLRRMMAN